MTRPVAAGLVLVSLVTGCRQTGTGPTPVGAGLNPDELTDAAGYGDGSGRPVVGGQEQVYARIRASQRPAELPPRKTCLALSGGGAYGAYQAGLLVGWTESGTRPEFDSVTGVSTGALVAGLAFLGPDYDGELRRVYTTLKTEEVYTKKRGLRGLLSDSLADNAPLARQIDDIVTPQVVCRFAAEHRKGRRLYVGTTDLDGRRAVVWDVGAVAARGDPDARELICKLFLASAAIPAFFPPVAIPVEVDGRRLVERHVDGGMTQNLFFRPPTVPAEYRSRPPADFLFGSDLYVVVAGKLYPDPEEVKLRTLKIASSSISTLIFAETQAELVKLFSLTLVAGMSYHLASLPQDFPAPAESTKFDPVEMTKMFDEGRRQAVTGTAWRATAPSVGEAEVLAQRSGTRLTRQARGPAQSSPATRSRESGGWPESWYGVPATLDPISK